MHLPDPNLPPPNPSVRASVLPDQCNGKPPYKYCVPYSVVCGEQRQKMSAHPHTPTGIPFLRSNSAPPRQARLGIHERDKITTDSEELSDVDSKGGLKPECSLSKGISASWDVTNSGVEAIFPDEKLKVHCLYGRKRVLLLVSGVLLLIIVIISALLLPSSKPNTKSTSNANCVRVMERAEHAYMSQVDYVRRGVTTATAKFVFAKFITEVITRSRDSIGETGRQMPVLQLCVSSDIFSSLQQTNGTILEMARLEKEIVSTDERIALLSHSIFPGDTSKDVADKEWKITEAFLSDFTDTVVNPSDVTFPDELTIRCDPYTDDACAEFNRVADGWGDRGAVSARNLTSVMVSLASTLLARGVKEAMARQLLLHSIAYTYLGARCRKCDKGELMVPATFVSEYGRIAGKLGRTKNGTKGLSFQEIQACLLAEVDILTGYGGAGVIPKMIIDGTGKLQDFNLPLDATKNATGRIHDCIQEQRAGALKQEEEPIRRDATTRAEGFCSSGFVYVEREKGEELTKAHCCADMCVGCAQGLGSLGALAFTEGCCGGCNEEGCDCVSLEVQDATKAGATELRRDDLLHVPPYGEAEGFAIKILI